MLHVVSFITWIFLFELGTGGLRIWSQAEEDVHPLEGYGYLGSAILYLIRFSTSLLLLPACICNTLGLILFNSFKDKIQLKSSPPYPFICIRVVTKGDYPVLVRKNVAANIETCFKAGMKNFMVEVVTDKALNLEKSLGVREIVVPTKYMTKSGALFKARALQYCWEDDVNELSDEDWVVHLDEETRLTEDSVSGILNFCCDKQHQFGQGVITYANGEIISWIATFADSYRVADDLGKLQFQFYYFHRPLFSWKGSYVVTSVAAERKITFDHGPDGSIAEDCYFAMIAYREGYSFNFIEGEMHEASPFTIWDVLQQRKRWLQGMFLTVRSNEIPWRIKFFLACSLYAAVTLPLATSNLFFVAFFPLPHNSVLHFVAAYDSAVALYMYIFGVVKSFSHRCRRRPWKLLFYVAVASLVTPINLCIENIASIYCLFGGKHQFYVVNKAQHDDGKASI